MGMVVQHNINAMTAYNKLNTNVSGLKKSSEKLASGYRINRAGDDAAGLAISEKMRSQIRGLNQAVRNSQDGINMIQTYEGAAQGAHNILQRMKELASESANGTYDNTTDRDAIQLEFDHLNDELNQMADTDFNGRLALNGGTMADGTIATNNTTIAGKPQVRTNKVDDPASAATYMKQVVGNIDVAGNGNIIINGTSVELEGGATAADVTVGSTTYSVENFALDNGKFDATGKITAKTVLQINEDTTDITIFGKSYKVGKTVTSSNQAAVDAYNTAWNTYVTDETAAGRTPTKAGFNATTAGQAVLVDGKEPTPLRDEINFKLMDEGGAEVKKINSTDENVEIDNDAKTITITEEYHLDANGAIKDNKGNGETIGTLGLTKGVSVSDAFDHGRRNLTYSNSITLQTGARSKDAVDFTFKYTTSGIGDLTADLDISSRGLGTAQLSLVTAEKANEAIDHIDNAINKVSMVRATFGAAQNRLEHKIDNLTTTSTNLSEAESNIRDTDMANEMMNYTKYNILQQAAQSMLAQANQQPQSILQLLG